MPYTWRPASAGLEEIRLKADTTGDFVAGNQQLAICNLQSAINLKSAINLQSEI
jgi:hypothetical protein